LFASVEGGASGSVVTESLDRRLSARGVTGAEDDAEPDEAGLFLKAMMGQSVGKGEVVAGWRASAAGDLVQQEFWQCREERRRSLHAGVCCLQSRGWREGEGEEKPHHRENKCLN